MNIKTYISSGFMRVQKILGIKREYAYRYFSIMLPADHRLPIYQHQHPKDDRFVSHIAKTIAAHATSLVVVAN